MPDNMLTEFINEKNYQWKTFYKQHIKKNLFTRTQQSFFPSFPPWRQIVHKNVKDHSAENTVKSVGKIARGIYLPFSLEKVSL